MDLTDLIERTRAFVPDELGGITLDRRTEAANQALRRLSDDLPRVVVERVEENPVATSGLNSWAQDYSQVEHAFAFPDLPAIAGRVRVRVDLSTGLDQLDEVRIVGFPASSGSPVELHYRALWEIADVPEAHEELLVVGTSLYLATMMAGLYESGHDIDLGGVVVQNSREAARAYRELAAHLQGVCDKMLGNSNG